MPRMPLQPTTMLVLTTVRAGGLPPGKAGKRPDRASGPNLTKA